MNLLRRWFGPSNALLFLYDHLQESDLDVFESELLEAKKFYRFVKVNELALALREGTSQGLLAVAFRQTRKSFFLRALPILRAHEIPVTLFVVADNVGTNRLTNAEELEIYFSHYPSAFPGDGIPEKREAVWSQPQSMDRFLRECRTIVGPLPLNQLDPTSYGSTWGKILEIPPHLREVGLHITGQWEVGRIEQELAFVGQQVGSHVTSAYVPRSGVLPQTLPSRISALVVEKSGAIESTTSPFALPYWNREG